MAFIEFKNISKSFGDNQACRQISLKIEKGTVHSIIGENGAGKSTLVKILGGIYQATSGQLFLNEQGYHPQSAQDAYKNKIAFIHQHFVLADHLTVMDNLVLSSSASLPCFNNQPRSSIRQKAQALLNKFNWSIPLDAIVHTISVGDQQRLEILKALLQEPEIIIFDEPTAVLTPQESSDLLDFILDLKKDQKTILLISHKLNEIQKVSDMISVMRQGQLIHTAAGTELSCESMAEMMIGRKSQKVERVRTAESVTNSTKKKIQLTFPNSSIEIYQGEVFGVAGIEGNGQSELIQNLLTEFKNKKLSFGDISEDRLRLTVFDEMTLTEHMLLKHPSVFLKNGLLQSEKLSQETQKLVKEWDVRPGEIQQNLSELSGGNQQKFVVGRELYHQPDVLLAAHPTRGVDLGAQEKIHQAFLNYAQTERTVFLISSELQEVLNLSDRYVILSKGHVLGPFERTQLNEMQIGLYMTGAHQ